MSSIIKKIKLINYKRFRNYEIVPNEHLNIFVGDNEVGKSTILDAIDVVASGNARRVESIGIEKLLNVESVHLFKCGDRKLVNLPILVVELYLQGDFDHTMNGKNNTDHIICDGIRLICEPDLDYTYEINESLKTNGDYFPYDYYSVRFSTFADSAYTNNKKKIRCVLVDSANMNSDYATNDFIKRMYLQYTENSIKERAIHRNDYRQVKEQFRSRNFNELNSRIPKDKEYTFGLKTGNSFSFESELMIFENNVGIDNKGTGKQVFMKTDFALERSGQNVDIILIEEPENHLSHLNLRKLVQRVLDKREGQLFITTHNSLISTRLDLHNLMIMHLDMDERPLSLKDLDNETTKYFMKAPVANVIEFSLSRKVVLVEGPSEYMLLERFYETLNGNRPDINNVNIMDIRGLSFKRYLDIAKLLRFKVAVVTDNDCDPEKNCITKYRDYITDNTKVFFEPNKDQYTFEIVLYECNKELCDRLFGEKALDYMLKNKTEAAYQLLNQETEIAVPDYIKRAISWIKE